MKKNKIETLKEKIVSTKNKIEKYKTEIEKLEEDIKQLNKEVEEMEIEELKTYMKNQKLSISEAISILNGLKRGEVSGNEEE